MILTDTHSHIYDEAFDRDRDEAVQRALDKGVERIFLPAIDSASHESMFKLVRKYPGNCFPMMGLHPTSVNDNPDYERELDLVRRYLETPPQGVEKFFAVGEVGLDLYWSRQWADRQEEIFEAQIELSLEYGLPLVIHTRSAWDEMRRTLSKFTGSGIKGIMHSFSGSVEDYLHIKECGDFLFGIGGVVTYKNSGLADIVSQMDMRDIVLETDCPYLTPVPFRGKRNESAYLEIIARKVSDIKGLEIEDTARITTENSRRILGC